MTFGELIYVLRGKIMRQVGANKDFDYYLEVECLFNGSNVKTELPVNKETWEKTELGYRARIDIEKFNK